MIIQRKNAVCVSCGVLVSTCIRPKKHNRSALYCLANASTLSRHRTDDLNVCNSGNVLQGFPAKRPSQTVTALGVLRAQARQLILSQTTHLRRSHTAHVAHAHSCNSQQQLCRNLPLSSTVTENEVQSRTTETWVAPDCTASHTTERNAHSDNHSGQGAFRLLLA